jgi:acetyl-CoA synthetase
VQRGDRVAIYMPMVLELPIAILACARIGAPHTVVFGGFSAEALRDRILDADARFVITADGGYRRGKPFALKAQADRALAETPLSATSWSCAAPARRWRCRGGATSGGTRSWRGKRTSASRSRMDSEDMLYLLYTSGSTGKPKGILHTTAGYLLGTSFTHRHVFDLQDDDIYWCAADIGWVTGHSYIVYGPLANGATGVPLRGDARLPRLRPLVGDHRALRGDDPLLRADGDSGHT